MAGLLNEFARLYDAGTTQLGNALRGYELPETSVMDNYKEPQRYIGGYVNPEEPLEAPNILGGLISLDPTEYLGPQHLAKVGMLLKGAAAGGVAALSPAITNTLLDLAARAKGVTTRPSSLAEAFPKQMGIIRRDGNPELVAVHQAPLERYALWAQTQGKLPQEMYSPSIAINKGAISQDFGSETGGTIHFVGRPDALDPARLNARLYNRDAYTPRDSAYAGGRSELLGQNINEIPATMDPRQYTRNFAEDRLRDKELIDRPGSRLPKNLRFLETASADLMPFEHKASIQSSPSFRSFKEFEQSPRGAALLGESSVAPNASALQANRSLEAAMFNLERTGNPAAKAFLERQAQYLDEPTGRGLALNLGDWRRQPGAKDVEKALREYRKALAYLPSQYAELKVSGPLQIRGNNFSGAIIAPPKKPTRLYQPESINAVADLLRQRGIPTMINDPAAPLTPQDLGWLARAYSEGVIK